MSEFIPLSEPNIGGNAWKYVKQCLDTGWVSGAGAFVDQFEEKICKYTGSPYAVAVVNGTSGLQLALRLCGVRPGDEVLVPTLTFIAPINTVRYVGAEPVFMDCDNFMNLDPKKTEEFLKKECHVTRKGVINKKTHRIIKAIIPVHVFGNPCDMKEIMRVARRFNLKVIEDATESLGSRYTEGKYKGRHTGTIGDFGVFSFNGNKIATTGSGGTLITADKKLAAAAKHLSTQAKLDGVRYVHDDVGYNFRLTNMQAALGLAQLEQLPSFIKIKKSNYLAYKKAFSQIQGLDFLGIPKGVDPNYWFYSLSLSGPEQREALMAFLVKQGIQSRPVWELNHRQKPYAHNQSYRIEKSPEFRDRVLNIPCSSGLTSAKVNKVCSAIKEFVWKK
ncbi:MAG: aminotransferase DegT [Elusimicrobia bacterium GWD2_63_28]|nr:MAG: aminotransferase DegT [Elusimicrobia bacterium GWD2_63_28]